MSHFDEDKLKLFHSLERALKTANIKNTNLCWHIQTENYLRKEFKKIKMNNEHLINFKNFDSNLQNFLNTNKINDRLFFKNIDFLHKCDKIIYHRTHADQHTSDMITSLP